MSVLVAGTGPFPEPGCPCAACRAGVARGGAAALLDGVALDPGVRDGVLWAPAGLASVPAGPVRLAFLGPGPDGDLTRVARDLAALRAGAVLTPDAQVALVGATHASARGPRRALLLAAWGMVEPQDGAVLPGAAPAAPPLRTLVIGGSSSGKSALAEQLVSAHPRVDYLATGPVPDGQDDEWAARVARHVRRRPAGWRTVETARPWEHLAGSEPVLLDSVGTWLAGALDRSGAWTGAAGWEAALEQDVERLVTAWTHRNAPAVAVTDEVGWGVVPDTRSGRLFRDRLGALNARLADASDRTLVVVANQILHPTPPPQ